MLERAVRATGTDRHIAFCARRGLRSPVLAYHASHSHSLSAKRSRLPTLPSLGDRRRARLPFSLTARSAHASTCAKVRWRSILDQQADLRTPPLSSATPLRLTSAEMPPSASESRARSARTRQRPAYLSSEALCLLLLLRAWLTMQAQALPQILEFCKCLRRRRDRERLPKLTLLPRRRRRRRWRSRPRAWRMRLARRWSTSAARISRATSFSPFMASGR